MNEKDFISASLYLCLSVFLTHLHPRFLTIFLPPECTGLMPSRRCPR